MKSLSGKKLCKVVEKFGWTLIRVKGSHHIYTKDNVGESDRILSMHPKKRDYAPRTLRIANRVYLVARSKTQP